MDEGKGSKETGKEQGPGQRMETKRKKHGKEGKEQLTQDERQGKSVSRQK
jgi:hypothetical protein